MGARVTAGGALRVLVVDSDPILRTVIRINLDLEHDIEVVGEAATSDEAIDMVWSLRPRLVTLPVLLIGEDGIRTARVIREVLPSTVVLIVSAQASEETVDAARATGAAGYLLKPFTPRELVEAVRAAHRGGPFFVVGRM